MSPTHHFKSKQQMSMPLIQKSSSVLHLSLHTRRSQIPLQQHTTNRLHPSSLRNHTPNFLLWILRNQFFEVPPITSYVDEVLKFDTLVCGHFDVDEVIDDARGLRAFLNRVVRPLVCGLRVIHIVWKIIPF